MCAPANISTHPSPLNAACCSHGFPINGRFLFRSFLGPKAVGCQCPSVMPVILLIHVVSTQGYHRPFCLLSWSVGGVGYLVIRQGHVPG